MGFQLTRTSLFVACIATVFLATVAAQNSTAAGPSLIYGYYINGYGPGIQLKAASTLIGPYPPGTGVGIYIVMNNPSSSRQNITEVRVSWPGQPKDWVQNSVAFGQNFVPMYGTVLNNVAIWGIDPISNPAFSIPPYSGGPNIFTSFCSIGNVNAEFLPVTIQMTDDVYGTQSAELLIQIARPSPPPPMHTATPAPTVMPAASLAAGPAAGKTATPTPTIMPGTPSPSVSKNAPLPSTSAPTPTPTQTRTPTPSPNVAKNQSPTPTATTSKTAAPTPSPTASKDAPSPSPTTPAPTATKPSKKHNGRRMFV